MVFNDIQYKKPAFFITIFQKTETFFRYQFKSRNSNIVLKDIQRKKQRIDKSDKEHPNNPRLRSGGR